MKRARNHCGNQNSVTDDDTQCRLLKAEDALLDCNFKAALASSYDLLARKSIPVPIASLSFENDESLQLALDLDGPFSRCGAVLLQSWYELSRTSGTKNPPQHFLEVLKPTIPLDLWIVWMTLRMDQRPGDVEAICRMTLSILEKLVLSNDVTYEVSEQCRESCREVIYLLFLEWLPQLPVSRIHDLGGTYVHKYRNDAATTYKRLLRSSSCHAESASTACANVCIEFSRVCRDWAQQPAVSCASKLQKDLLELRLEQEAPQAGLIVHVTRQWLKTTDSWLTIFSDCLVAIESHYQITRMNRNTQWRIVKGITAAAVLLFGCRRVRLLLRNVRIHNGVSEIFRALGYRERLPA